jgi:hypothetical protein
MPAVGNTYLQITDVNGLHAFFTMRAPGSRVCVGHAQQEVSQEELISLPTSQLLTLHASCWSPVGQSEICSSQRP